jgi:DNA-binding transcriptional regulator WhiA
MSYHLEIFINNVGNIKNIFKLTHPLLKKKKKEEKRHV